MKLEDGGPTSDQAARTAAFGGESVFRSGAPAGLVSVALANKAARIAWVILIRGETYRGPVRGGSRMTTENRLRLPTASRSLAERARSRLVPPDEIAKDVILPTAGGAMT
jgi:hypothetical protein